MALPTTPASRWIQNLDRPFRLFEDSIAPFDDYQLTEEDDHFLLTVDMPGYDPEEITVSWDEGVLNVAAEHDDEERNYRRTFHRRFKFPKQIADDEIEAQYRNGVLEVTLPLEEGALVRGTEIPVEG